MKALFPTIILLLFSVNLISQSLEYRPLESGDKVAFTTIDLANYKWIENIDGKYYCLIPFEVKSSIDVSNTFWVIISCKKAHLSLGAPDWGIYTDTGDCISKENYQVRYCPEEEISNGGRRFLVRDKDFLTQNITPGKYFIKFFSYAEVNILNKAGDIDMKYEKDGEWIGVNTDEFDVSIGSSSEQFFNNFLNDCLNCE